MTERIPDINDVAEQGYNQGWEDGRGIRNGEVKRAIEERLISLRKARKEASQEGNVTESNHYSFAIGELERLLVILKLGEDNERTG